jgi:Tol biopolymer transport system component
MIGSSIGPFQIVGRLGAGGMGEVYRAHDTKLNRDVALKVLPDAFAFDPDRLARFKREAQVLASLNHPHIAAIYGFEDSGSTHALVLELVEGPTLADRIARGPIPLDEALPIAKQIADALEVAHEQGIIHRDLKPANIKLRPDGTVKVLDFGLAKALEPASSLRVDVTASPTLTSPAVMTGVGMILGTAAYMAPEQARGRAIDRRADIWAFGAVLFEMLAGRRLFEGDDVADVMASVIKSDADWSALPPNVPPPIRRLLRRCLQKDLQRRLPHIGAARLELDEGEGDAELAATSLPGVRSTSRGFAVTASASAAVIGAIVAGAAVWQFKPAPARPVTRFAHTLPEPQRFTTTNRQFITVSPDGSQLVYIANGLLYVKSMSDVEARPVRGVESLPGLANPVFSPDGKWIAYWTLSDLTVRRIPVVGGAPVTVCRVSTFLFEGMSWDESGIVFGQSGGVMRVSPNGGTPEVIVPTKEGELPYGPQILPDKETVLFTLAHGTTSDRWEKAQIVVQSLKSGARKILVEGGSDARYLPTGHLVYALGGTLLAVPFNLKRLEVSGGATLVLEGVRRGLGNVTAATQFATSANGSIVYVAGPASTSSSQDLALIDRTGTPHPLNLPSDRPYGHPRTSPDGKRVAFAVDDGREAAVWVYDLAGTSAIRRLTFGGNNRFPVWTADGQRVAFQSDREGDAAVFWQRADGAGMAERLTRPDAGASHAPESWSRDDVLSVVVSQRPSELSLSTFSLRDRKLTTLDGLRSTAVFNSAFSPDGRWLAYVITGVVDARGGVFVQPFPATGARYQVDDEGRGIYPVWSRDGRELFFTPPGRLIAVPVKTEKAFEPGKPVSLPRGFLVNGTGTATNYDVTPDGRFLGVIDATLPQLGNPTAPQIQVVLNWFEELKQRVPMK